MIFTTLIQNTCTCAHKYESIIHFYNSAYEQIWNFIFSLFISFLLKLLFFLVSGTQICVLFTAKACSSRKNYCNIKNMSLQHFMRNRFPFPTIHAWNTLTLPTRFHMFRLWVNIQFSFSMGQIIKVERFSRIISIEYEMKWNIYMCAIVLVVQHCPQRFVLNWNTLTATAQVYHHIVCHTFHPQS